jgi:hypothetical protein
MRFWSEGLGDSELVMGLDRARLERKDDIVLLSGIVDQPAPWEYEVKIQFSDWVTILRTATSKEACDFIASHMRLGALAAMAWSIVKFVVLLGAYRLAGAMRETRIATAPLEKLQRPEPVRHLESRS